MTVTATARRFALVGLVALVAALLPFASATAQDDPIAYELSGQDADVIAQAWSELAYPDAAVAAGDGPTEVLLGRDDLFADNLASGALQGGTDTGRPLLLTASDALSQVTADELARLGGSGTITTVHILGGTEAISADVETELTDAGYGVNRFEGETRTETAIDIAATVYPDADTALLVRSTADSTDPTQEFADSLGAGAWAAEAGVPVLFTQSDVLTGTTADYLESSSIETVIIIGGTSAVSADVEAEVAAIVTTVDRVEGPTRFDTAVAINESRTLGGEAAVLVDGQVADAWVNGFAAANVSGNNGYPLVLSNQGELPQASQDYLEAFYQGTQFAAHFTGVSLVCGTNAGDACDDAAAITGAVVTPFPPPAPPSNETFNVLPGDEALITVGEERQFTVDNAVADTEHQIVLVEQDDVSVDENGIVSFQDDDNNDEADLDLTGAAQITVINGSAFGPAPTASVMPVGSTINFTVEGVASGSFYAVVYFDADGDGDLDLNEGDDNTPVADEIFGVSGLTTVIAEEAADGTPAAGTVLSVDDQNRFAEITGPNTVFFRDGDTYRLDPGTGFYPEVSPEEFFTNLSVDDFLFTCDGSAGIFAAYDQDGPNEYCLDDLAPAGPTNVAAANGDPADTVVDLTWTASTTASVDSYNVYMNDEACLDTTVAELMEAGSTEETEFSAQGLSPNTTYCFVVTAVDGDDESTLAVGTGAADGDNTVEWTTQMEIDAPIIQAAELDTDAPIVGIPDTGDVWAIAFNEDMAATSATTGTLTLEDSDGDLFLVDCASIAANPNDFITDATCALSDEDGNGTSETLTVTLSESAEDRNAAGDGDILYPVTIVDTENITDTDDGAAPDLAASTDVVIG